MPKVESDLCDFVGLDLAVCVMVFLLAVWAFVNRSSPLDLLVNAAFEALEFGDALQGTIRLATLYLELVIPEHNWNIVSDNGVMSFSAPILITLKSFGLLSKRHSSKLLAVARMLILVCDSLDGIKMLTMSF